MLFGALVLEIIKNVGFMDFSRFAQKVTDNRNEMRLGIFFALQVPIFLDTGYETAIVGVLAVLSAVVCLCHIYSLRQRDECFSNQMNVSKINTAICPRRHSSDAFRREIFRISSRTP